MRITREELQIHPIVVSKEYAPGALDYQRADFRQDRPLKVDAVAELVGAEIRIRGHLGTRLAASCDRCLAAVDIPIEQDFDLFYSPMSTIAREETEVEVPKDELGVGFYTGDGIELADVVTEQAILALPMKVVCGLDCRGLCPVCGANLNQGECDCTPAKGSSPFSSLNEG